MPSILDKAIISKNRDMTPRHNYLSLNQILMLRVALLSVAATIIAAFITRIDQSSGKPATLARMRSTEWF